MDIILYNIGIAILLLIIGYLFGCIPNGIWIGKLFFHKDPRDYGSGNTGGTNVGRTFGKKFGFLTIILDIAKVIVPVYLTWLFMIKVPLYNNLPLMPAIDVKYSGADISGYLVKWPAYWMILIGATLGHCYPVFNHFKGGKNAAIFYGVTVGTNWFSGAIPGTCFWIILKAKKMVSLSSILGSWISVVMAWIWAILMATGVIHGSTVWIITYGPCLECNYVYAIAVTFASAILTLKHKDNIKRILEGTERKIKWMK